MVAKNKKIKKRVSCRSTPHCLVLHVLPLRREIRRHHKPPHRCLWTTLKNTTNKKDVQLQIQTGKLLVTGWNWWKVTLRRFFLFLSFIWMWQKLVPNKDYYEGIPTETQMIIRQNSSFCLRRLSQNENVSFLLRLGTPHFGPFLISFFFFFFLANFSHSTVSKVEKNDIRQK